MDQQQINEQAEAAVNKAEAGDKDGLSKQLNSMSREDRVAVAQEMERINEQHRQSNDSLPKIEITIGESVDGIDQLPLNKRALTAPGSEYRGEGIRQEIEPATYSLGSYTDTGQTERLEDVASAQHLRGRGTGVANVFQKSINSGQFDCRRSHRREIPGRRRADNSAALELAQGGQ